MFIHRVISFPFSPQAEPQAATGGSMRDLFLDGSVSLHEVGVGGQE